MYMLIILEIIDIFFLLTEKHGREACYKLEDNRGTYTLDTTSTYTPEGCSESLFYLQLSHILNFQTLLLTWTVLAQLPNQEILSLICSRQRCTVVVAGAEEHQGPGKTRES